MNNDVYHRQAAWAALISVAPLAAGILIFVPWIRWVAGVLILAWAIKRCVVVRRL